LADKFHWFTVSASWPIPVGSWDEVENWTDGFRLPVLLPGIVLGLSGAFQLYTNCDENNAWEESRVLVKRPSQKSNRAFTDPYQNYWREVVTIYKTLPVRQKWLAYHGPVVTLSLGKLAISWRHLLMKCSFQFANFLLDGKYAFVGWLGIHLWLQLCYMISDRNQSEASYMNIVSCCI